MIRSKSNLKEINTNLKNSVFSKDKNLFPPLLRDFREITVKYGYDKFASYVEFNYKSKKVKILYTGEQIDLLLRQMM